MSDTKIPKPYFMRDEVWAGLTAGRQWQKAGEQLVEDRQAASGSIDRLRTGAQAAVQRHLGEKIWHAMGGPTILLTTIGRKSGKESTVAINYMPHGNDVFVVGSLAGLPVPPQWALNLDATPRGWVQIKDLKWEVRARKLTREEKAQWWAGAMTSLFPLWWEFQMRCPREFMLFRLSPV